MKIFLFSLLCAASVSTAHANPMLDLCLPLAPKTCALTKDSASDDYLKCFENVMLRVKVAKERACASELLHARLHKACATDIPTVCAGVKPGDNRTMKCIGANFSKLSKPCQDAYAEYMKLEGGERKKGRGHAGVSAVRC